jgi:CRISPR-associated protein Csd1
VPPELDRHSTDPGYLAGRLFAVIVTIESTVIPDAERPVGMTHYQRVSTTPAAFLPPLIESARRHLGTMRRTRPSTARILERELDAAIAAFDRDFPSRLDLKGIGRFAIAYAQERAGERRRQAHLELQKRGIGDAAMTSDAGDASDGETDRALRSVEDNRNPQGLDEEAAVRSAT